MYVEIDNADALEMLMDKVRAWGYVPEIEGLYEQMYERMIDEGVFDGEYFNVSDIVDDDVEKYCEAYEPGDNDYAKIKSVWERGDDEVAGIGYIEAENAGWFLVRRY